MLDEIIMIWNYRGAASKEFVRELKELVKGHRPMVIVLLEPRVSSDSVDEACKRLGESRWIQSEAFGFSSGVWIM